MLPGHEYIYNNTTAQLLVAVSDTYEIVMRHMLQFTQLVPAHRTNAFTIFVRQHKHFTDTFE